MKFNKSNARTYRLTAKEAMKLSDSQQISALLTTLVIILCIIIFSNVAIANNGEKDETKLEMLSWYNDYRFTKADANKDGFLDKDEIRRSSKDWSHYKDDRYFRRADRNIDNKLSKMEALLKIRFENQVRQQRDKMKLTGIRNADSTPQTYEVADLQDNPGLARQLFASDWWLENNAETAKQLYTNKNWVKKNNGAFEALMSNRNWLAVNPQAALALYNAHPDYVKKNTALAAFAKSQTTFLKKHPKLSKQLQSQLR